MSLELDFGRFGIKGGQFRSTVHAAACLTIASTPQMIFSTPQMVANFRWPPREDSAGEVGRKRS